MATLVGAYQLTGTLGNLTAYKIAGSEKIHVKLKGGPSRESVKTSPRFENTRRNNNEWRACIKAARTLRHAIGPIRHLKDHNYAGKINGFCRHIQRDDKISAWGQRNLLFSAYGKQLEGFGLNKRHPFSSIVQPSLEFGIDRIGGCAFVNIPELKQGINLYNPLNKPLFKLIACLGAVPDFLFEGNYYQPAAAPFITAMAETDWAVAQNWSNASILNLQIENWQDTPGVTLILSVGIEFGVPVSDRKIDYVKYSGAGKVLKLS